MLLNSSLSSLNHCHISKFVELNPIYVTVEVTPTTNNLKSAYRLATTEHDESLLGGTSSSSPHGERSLWNCIWKAVVPQKMKITTWMSVCGPRSTRQTGTWLDVEP